MNKASNKLRVLISACVLSGFALAVCAQPASAPVYSGFLKNYNGLQAYQDALGNQVMRKVDPALNPHNYNAVIIDPVQLYPAPQPTDAVSAQTLTDIANYATSQLRMVIDPQVKIVDKPGPGVARLSVAITGSALEKEGLKAYQYIPIAFLFTAAKNAASGAPHQVKLRVEAGITDSVSGKQLLSAVREGTGDTFDGDKVTVDAMKPLLGQWMAGAANEIPKFFAPKK